MKRLLLNLGFGSLTLAATVFSASNAAASTTCKTSGGTVVTIVDPSTCHFVIGGGCTSQCTPVSFTTTCSAQCTASPVTTCTDTCQTKCSTACTTTPTTFTCKEQCSTDCQAGCMASCSGNGCSAQCSANCDTQCTESCKTHPGSTDCTTECGDCCSGSCTVQANISCDEACVTTLTGGCTTKCAQPSGSLFCDDQYIDIAAVTDCTFSLNVTATTSLDTKCAVSAPGSAPFGVPAGAALVAGLGLLVARRRRHA
jgi:MYXO-CTERM domain-containing protein